MIFFSKSMKVANTMNAYQVVLSLENVFSALIMRFFWQKKNRKLRTLEKVENMKSFFSRKKRFHLLKLHLHQIGKAQNMAMLAGRLVDFHFKVFSKKRDNYII